MQEKQEQIDRKTLEEKLRLRIENRMQLENQLQENRIRKLQQQDEDDLFRVEQMKLLAEQDKLELLSNEKRRLKIMEHHRAVRELIAERKAKRQCEIMELIKSHEKDARSERRR